MPGPVLRISAGPSTKRPLSVGESQASGAGIGRDQPLIQRFSAAEEALARR
jgi:hypothetical protein